LVLNILLFAGDAKLYFDIRSINDATILQSSLNTFFQWSKQNLLSLNINKCQIIFFTRSKNSIIYQYRIYNCSLYRKNYIKDLVVYFKNYLSFKLNHRMIINKSYEMLVFINRNTKKFKNTIYIINKI